MLNPAIRSFDYSDTDHHFLPARGQPRHDPGHLIDLAPTILEVAGDLRRPAGSASAGQEPGAGAGQRRLRHACPARRNSCL
jgi:hypothetical protein